MTKVTTTITTEIDLDTFEPTHSVDINATDDLPRQVIVAAVTGACRATLTSLGKGAVKESTPISDEEGDE